ncbi:SPW repeat protein [Mycobacterium sp. 141]|uniref:SPW repeat protein n=1 Tax=Mycobacterium sp. 141 TaxID=1120797 RepID=UPI0003738A04|nr:SPW repeat protein [Mycobacterium sp. 141]
MATVHSSIDQHPDILALRARYDRVAESMAAQATFGLTLMAALYVALSPWIIGYQGFTRLSANDLFVGGTVGVLALCFGCALDRSHGMTWTLPFFGVWLVISPWIYVSGPTAGMIWSHVLSGAVVFVLGLYAAYLGMRVRSSDARHA